MLKILKETENRIISDEELAEMIGFRNKDAYNYAKRKLYKKIEESEKIKEEALKIYPDFINYMKSLTIREIEILSILKEHQDNPLSNEEMAKLLGYKNINSYFRFKKNMSKKLSENIELKERLLSKYPFLSKCIDELPRYLIFAKVFTLDLSSK